MTGLVAARIIADGPVSVPEPPGSVESRRLCTALTDALPRRLDQLTARTVDGNAMVSAAWGDPPVTLRCGLIATPTPLGGVVTVDGVDWVPVSDKRGVTWTTVGRRATVQVWVPDAYDSQAPLLAELSPLILRLLPKPS